MTEQRQGASPRTTRPRHPERPCLNCGDPTYGEYCPRCGQHKVDVQVSVKAMVKDVLEDEFLLGRRLPHTLFALIFRPGFLTSEVLAGRVVRYVRPFKLYLASSVVFFLILSFISLRALEVGNGVEDQVRADSTDASEMGLAQLDSAIAAVDAQLDRPDVNAGAALALAAVLTSLESQRERLLAAGDSAPGVQEPTDEDEGGVDLPDIRLGSVRLDSVLATRTRRWEEMEPDEVGPEIARTFLAYVPTLMFLLLPVFAGALKLLYLRQRRFYAEHVVFVLHTHAFIFVIFTLMFLTRSWISGFPLAVLLLWVFAYIYLAMRRVYGQSHLRTFVKYWTLGWMYFWILLIGIPLLFVVSVLVMPA
jgi:hypothetical protein